MGSRIDLLHRNDGERTDSIDHRVLITGTAWFYREHGSGHGTVLLDGGFASPSDVWSHVITGLKGRVRALAVDRTESPHLDPADLSAHVQAYIEQMSGLIARPAATEPVALVGWDAGAIFVRSLLNGITGDGVFGVLIDPLPLRQVASLLAAGRQELAGLDEIRPAIAKCPADDHLAGRAPLTFILPGRRSESESDQIRSRLQYEDMSGLAHARQIIAGRSGDCVPIERPDVVIETILDYLDTNR